MIRLALVILIVFILGCDHIAPTTPREKYFRGDHVKALGIPGVITDKRFYNGKWNYELTYAAPSSKIVKDWVEEAVIGELVTPSPNRPQAERK